MRGRPYPVSDDEWAWILARLDRSGECWLWTGMKAQGYGRVRFRRGDRKPSGAVHRIVYERLVGPIPDGYEVDHLCRTKSCARPDHLEAVTGWLNNMRSTSLAAQRAQQTHCIHDHLLDGDNVYIHPKRGTRHCKQCRRDRLSRLWHESPEFRVEKKAKARAAYVRKKTA